MALRRNPITYAVQSWDTVLICSIEYSILGNLLLFSWNFCLLLFVGTKWDDTGWLWTPKEKALRFKNWIAWSDWMEPCGIIWEAVDACALPSELAFILDFSFFFFAMAFVYPRMDIQNVHVSHIYLIQVTTCLLLRVQFVGALAKTVVL